MKVVDWLRERAAETGSAEKALQELEVREGIIARKYDDSVVLNYQLMEDAVRYGGMGGECRGLHLSFPDFSVISRAFERFPNYGEPASENFDFTGSVVYDKIDGSLVILYHSPATGKWEFRTRGTAYAETGVDDTNLTFRELILSAAGLSDTDGISGLDPGVSYVLELTAPENRVIVPYKERALHFITAFVNETGEELSYDAAFSRVSAVFRVREIAHFGLTRIADVVKMTQKFEELAEGYVVRNRYGKRLKVKSPLYVSLHYLHANGPLTEKRVFEIMEAGEDAEYLAYFPEVTKRFDAIREREHALLSAVLETYAGIRDIENRKEFAQEALRYKYSGLLFLMRDRGENLEEIWRETKFVSKLRFLGIKDPGPATPAPGEGLPGPR